MGAQVRTLLVSIDLLANFYVAQWYFCASGSMFHTVILLALPWMQPGVILELYEIKICHLIAIP